MTEALSRPSRCRHSFRFHVDPFVFHVVSKSLNFTALGDSYAQFKSSP